MDRYTLDEKHAATLASRKRHLTFKNITWWVLLAMAVLVVPSLAYTVIAMVHATRGSEVILFIISCWVCVFLGMKLMKEPYIHWIILEDIALSETSKKRCINKITMIEDDVARWKADYGKGEALFMSLSKTPAWNYLNDLISILSTAKQQLEATSTVTIDTVKTLMVWIDSAKAGVIEGYLNSLEASYGYAKAEYAQQGKNVDLLYPQLGNGNIATFLNAPLSATMYARELWSVLEKEHPLIGRFVLDRPMVGRDA